MATDRVIEINTTVNNLAQALQLDNDAAEQAAHVHALTLVAIFLRDVNSIAQSLEELTTVIREKR